MLRRFCSYYRYYKGLFALDMIAALVSSLLSLFTPAIVRYILSTALPARMFINIIWLLIAIVVIYLLQAAATYIRIKWGHYLGVYMENRMRSELFSHLQELSFSYFDRTKTGTIMSRITNDLFNIAEVAHHCPEDFLISVATIVGAYVLMFSFSWQWTDTFYTASPFFTASAEPLLTNIVTKIPPSLKIDYAATTLWESAITNTSGLLVILPLFIIFLFAQRSFVEGIERSGIVG